MCYPLKNKTTFLISLALNNLLAKPVSINKKWSYLILHLHILLDLCTLLLINLFRGNLGYFSHAYNMILYKVVLKSSQSDSLLSKWPNIRICCFFVRIFWSCQDFSAPPHIVSSWFQFLFCWFLFQQKMLFILLLTFITFSLQ